MSKEREGVQRSKESANARSREESTPAESVSRQFDVSQERVAKLLDVGRYMHDFDLFVGLLADRHGDLRMLAERVEVLPGEVIIRQYEKGDSVYIVETGQAEVWSISPAGEEVLLATVGPDEYFGEIGLLNGGTRTAQVVAVTPMSLLRLSRTVYLRYRDMKT